jgi:hypothetical protein
MWRQSSGEKPNREFGPSRINLYWKDQRSTKADSVRGWAGQGGQEGKEGKEGKDSIIWVCVVGKNTPIDEGNTNQLAVPLPAIDDIKAD